MIMNIAMDWYGRNLYVIDEVKKALVACNVENLACTVLVRDLENPRDLQLDLVTRYIIFLEI